MEKVGTKTNNIKGLTRFWTTENSLVTIVTIYRIPGNKFYLFEFAWHFKSQSNDYHQRWLPLNK